MQALEPQIKQFNDLFINVHKGEEIILDYIPGSGTTVTIAGNLKGTIQGADFNRALFSIWLGDDPVGMICVMPCLAFNLLFLHSQQSHIIITIDLISELF
ncbi:MAG TPA: hypothetical protein EYH36_06575 [Desulfocapsa sulfexigens]|nr:hypothetical protein [Desulfocapsa sulfexigens]